LVIAYEVTETYSQPLGFTLSCGMPTALRIDGLRVVIYPNDHRPAHVHVIGGGGEAVFLLNCPDGPPVLRESFRFQVGDVRRITNLLAGEVPRLCAAWEAIHDQ
jgi:Domain of unknown function (DUF4160)